MYVACMLHDGACVAQCPVHVWHNVMHGWCKYIACCIHPYLHSHLHLASMLHVCCAQHLCTIRAACMQRTCTAHAPRMHHAVCIMLYHDADCIVCCMYVACMLHVCCMYGSSMPASLLVCGSSNAGVRSIRKHSERGQASCGA